MKNLFVSLCLVLLGHASWSQFNVTFRVDMNNVTQTFTTPEVNGQFNTWCGGCAPMTDANSDGIWELTIPLIAGSYEYKFAADAWGIQENLTSGSSCTVTNSGFTNRTITVTQDVVLDVVCWGACVACNAVAPTYNVTFRVDMNNVTQTFTTPEVNGQFNNFCGGCAPMTDANNDGIWELVIALPAGSYEYKFAADTWNIQESLTPGSSCTVTNFGFTNRIVNVSSDIVLDAVCWGACVSCNAVVPTYNVTFRVDMNNVSQAFTTPEVNGTFNSWCGGCAPMTDANNDGIWELVVSLQQGSYEYKFAADSWNIQETLTQGDPCTVNAAPFVNRTLNVNSNIVLDAVCWGSCQVCSPPTYNVTFRVDMNNVTQAFTTPEVNGTFNSWCGGCAPMTDANNDGIWELVVALPANNYEYKFAADSWNIQESLIQGASCTVGNSPFVNRALTVTQDVVLDLVCWGSCQACSAPTYNVTFRVDMNNVSQAFTTPEVNGQFNSYCGGCAPMSDANNDGIWELVIPLQAGSYEYKFAADTWNIQENLTPGSACTVTNFGFTNRIVNVSSDVVLDAVCWGACVGCNAVVPEYDVTFRVNMNNVTAGYTTPEVNGQFNSWCGGCAPMSDANNDGIWELVITLQQGSYEYKFAADSWNIQETLTQGDACTVNGAPFVNRFINVTGDIVLDAVCWGSCSAGSLVMYADNDGDGFGAGTSTLFCTAPASGYSTFNTDCNDNNASVYPGTTELCSNSIDDDCDGSVNEGCVPAPANDNRASAVVMTGVTYPLCSNKTGTLLNAGDNGEALSSEPVGTGEDVWYSFVAQSQGARIQANSSQYNLALELQDAAGTTLMFSENETSSGQEVLIASGLTVGATYYVAVRNFGVLDNSIFTICIQHLRSSVANNGTTFANLCSYIKASWTGAQLYSATFVNGSDSYTASNNSTQIPFSLFNGLQYGTSYSVTFSNTFILPDAGGNNVTTVVTSAPFNVTIAAHPSVELRAADRCPTARTRGAFISTNVVVCGAVEYEWEFLEVDANDNVIGIQPIVVESNSTSRYMRVSQIPGVQDGDRYRVRIRPVFSYGPGTFTSGYQLLCVAGQAPINAPILEEGDVFAPSAVTAAERAFEVYPNPNAGDVFNVRLAGINSEIVIVRMLDAMGRVVYNNQFTVVGSLNTSIVMEEKLSSGMYMIQVIDGEETMTNRMIVQ